MNHLLIATVVALAAVASANPALAATASVMSAPTQPGIVLVSGGCGPGGFRDAYGYCRPRPVYARYCRPGWHLTPYGCRPNY